MLRADDTLWCCDPREALVTRLDTDRALARLPAERRRLLEALAGGEDRNAIAAREGVKRVTVDVRVLRARQAMAAAL